MSVRISLASLFIVVASAAMATAVLLRPTFYVASTVWSLTLLVLGAAIVAAFASSGRQRASWAGFAFLGYLHLILATAPWFDELTGRFIVTRHILDKLGTALEYDVKDLSQMYGMTQSYGILRNLPWALSNPPTKGPGYLSYLVAGQSMFSLVIALAGGLVGRFYYARRQLPERSRSASGTYV